MLKRKGNLRYVTTKSAKKYALDSTWLYSILVKMRSYQKQT